MKRSPVRYLNKSYLLFIIISLFFITTLIFPPKIMSYIPGWSYLPYLQPVPYQVPFSNWTNPLLSYSPIMNFPWPISSGWPIFNPSAYPFFSRPSQSLTFYNQPSPFLDWSNPILPWQGLASNPFMAGELTLLYNLRMPFGQNIFGYPKARPAAANPTPQSFIPTPVGIELPLIKYAPPALQSIGINYIPGLPGYINGQVVVTFRPGIPLAEMSRVYATHQCRELYTSPYAGFKVLALPPYLTVIDAARRLSLEPCILYASPNYYRHAHLIPNDPYYPYQWHLSTLNASYAWDISVGTGAMVGLLDSGVAYQTLGVYAKAPDLAGTLFATGYDFVNLDAFPDDDYGHGTHMAGCIAQTTNNLLGVAGVAFASTIMPVKVMDNTGLTAITTEVDGIYYAVNNGVNIISMSLGGAGTDVTEQAAVTYAYNAGVTIVCSAGNAASSALEYPASYPECLSISSIRYDYTLPTYSNYGTAIDFCAPGGDLSVDQNLDGFGDGILQQTFQPPSYTTFYYYFMEGTSPACALVSGVAALIVSKSTLPLTPLQVTTILQGSAKDLGTIGWDQYYGFGLVNPYLALLQTP